MIKGSYLLVIWLNDAKQIMVRKLGYVNFSRGWYIYVGSALSGVHQRVKRHMRISKKLHWHIDYLLLYAEIIDVYYFESVNRIECEIAGFLSANCETVKGFGCSDCKCNSHLFFCRLKEPLEVISLFDEMKKLKIETT